MRMFEELSDEQVAEQITTWAGRVAAGEARLLELVAEFDRREAWAGPGLLSCAHWLSWRVGMGLTAARERVRVARSLQELPATAAAFLAGRLSWTQVRAITRVATADDELTYVELARRATGAQLERLVRGVRRARRVVEDEADPELAGHRMRTRVRYDLDGTLVLTVRLAAPDGAVVLAALEQARADLDRARHAGRGTGRSFAQDPDVGLADTAAPAPAQSSAEDCALPPPRASLGEGLLHLTATWLGAHAAARPGAARRRRAFLVAQLDPLSGWARLSDGELLPPGGIAPPGTSRPGRPGLRPVTDTDLAGQDLGRTARLPSLGLRELLATLDGERCRFPGCTRHRALHAHHVHHWADGGPTDLANLVLLCARHHTRVHADGFVLRLDADRTLQVTSAGGLPVAHHPPLPWQTPEQLAPTVGPTTLPPQALDRLDLRYAVTVLLQQAA